MKKDFIGWNVKKIDVNAVGFNKLYRQRDVWWCVLGINIGNEQDGNDDGYQRPVLILRGLSSKTCIIVPLTTSGEVHGFRIDVGIIAGKKAKAIISQIKVIDTKRLVNKIGVVNKDTFETIIKSIRGLF